MTTLDDIFYKLEEVQDGFNERLSAVERAIAIIRSQRRSQEEDELRAVRRAGRLRRERQHSDFFRREQPQLRVQLLHPLQLLSNNVITFQESGEESH